MGGTKSVECNAIAYDIWEWAIAKHLVVGSTHSWGMRCCCRSTLL